MLEMFFKNDFLNMLMMVLFLMLKTGLHDVVCGPLVDVALCLHLGKQRTTMD